VVCEGVGVGFGVEGGDVSVGLGAGADDDLAGAGAGAPLEELCVVDGALLPDAPLLGLAPGAVGWLPARWCAAWRPFACLPLGLAEGVGLALGLEDGVVEVVVVDAAAWLKRFMKPTTPTALSRVARQVSTDTRRRPLSRRARSRSRYLIAANETASYVKRPPRATQAPVRLSAFDPARLGRRGRECPRWEVTDDTVASDVWNAVI
jgi:hypothetical protein